MKKILLAFLMILPVFVWGQSFTVQDNLNSVTISPESIKSNRDGFDEIRRNLVVGGSNLLFASPNPFQNIAIGYNALQNNGNGSTSPNLQSSRNIALGVDVLRNNTLGNDNIAIGGRGLFGNQTGNRNIAIGESSIFQASTSSDNIGIGYGTFQQLETGSENIAIGNQSLGYNSSSRSFHDKNTVLGHYSLHGSLSGQENTVVGYKAMQHNTSGSYNVAIGALTMEGNNPYLNSASNNVCVGYKSLFANRVGNGNVAIGYQAGYTETNSNKLYIENSNSSTPLIGGDFADKRVGINRSITAISSVAYTFQVGGDASKDVAGNWSSHSDRRLKKNIQSLDSYKTLQQLLHLQGVTYEWNDSVTNTKRPQGIQYGFIAQNIEEVFPSKVKKDSKGYLMTAYGDYDPMVIEAIRALNQKIEILEQKNASLSATIKDIYEVLNTNRKPVISTNSQAK